MSNYRKGDVNMDGLITSEDRDLIRNYYNGTDTNLTEEQIALADIDGDGTVSFSDVLASTELIDEEKKVFGLKNNGTKQEILTALVNGSSPTCVRGIYGSTQSDGSIVYPKSSGSGSMAIGCETSATGGHDFAGGVKSKSDGYASFAFGAYCSVSSDYSHAEGSSCSVSGLASHAEGGGCQAKGQYSHAEGNYSYAEGNTSHAEGFNVRVESDYQHAQGRYNIIDAQNKYAHIIGNGYPTTNESGTTTWTRSNAHTVDWDGNAWYQGDLRIGGTKYDDATSLLGKIEENKFELDKFNHIGGHNFIISNSHHIKMVQPIEDYNKYDFFIKHPMVLLQSDGDHYYTLSFKYIPTASGYSPAQSIVVGGMKSADAWQIRLHMDDFRVEHFKGYQLWSTTFTIRGNNDDFLQDHVGFVLQSTGGLYGGVVKEVKLENGKVRTDFVFNTAGIHSTMLDPVVGTWIDGRPIYRKVISGAYLGTTLNEWNVLGTIPGFNTITHFEGFLLGGTPGAHTFEPFPGKYELGHINVQFDQASGEIRESHTYDAVSGYWTYMTIEYTLAADEEVAI